MVMEFFSYLLYFHRSKIESGCKYSVYVSDLLRPNFLSIISFLMWPNWETLVSAANYSVAQEYFEVQVRKGKGNPYLPAPHIQGGCSARCFNFSLPLGKFHTLAGLRRAGGVIYKLNLKQKNLINYCWSIRYPMKFVNHMHLQVY